jgi:hypothetical protein
MTAMPGAGGSPSAAKAGEYAARKRRGFHPTTRKSGAQWGPRLKLRPFKTEL